MFNYFKNKNAKREREIEERAEQLVELVLAKRADEQKIIEEQKAVDEKLRLEEEDRLAKVALKNKRNAMKDSNEFYLEMIADKVTENGIRIELDWNETAITTLKKHGFTGDTDEDIIYDYLAILNKNAQLNSIAEEYVNEGTNEHQ